MAENESQVNSNKISEQEKLQIPKYIKISFLDSTWGNMICFIVYKIMKTIYISVWFYFAPFAVILLSYEIPYLLSQGTNT